MRVKIEVTIADTRIADLLEAAVCGYWVDDFVARFAKGAAEAENAALADYSDWVTAALTPYSAALVELEYDRTIGIDGYASTMPLNRDKIAAGLNRLAQTAHWQDFLSGNEDGTTGDVFLQLCLLGEVAFG
jgi:hypothetical protein